MLVSITPGGNGIINVVVRAVYLTTRGGEVPPVCNPFVCCCILQVDLVIVTDGGVLEPGSVPELVPRIVTLTVGFDSYARE